MSKSLNHVGLIVEGDTEFYALPKVPKLLPECPPLRAINLGGVGTDLTPAGIAKLVLPKVRQHLAANRKKVVICLDRESRPSCAGGLAGSIRTELLSALKKVTVDLSVVVADRTFEAWLLADALGLFERRVLKKKPKFFCFEGEIGKETKKGVVELDTLLDRRYSKTKDGPKLFENLRLDIARQHGTGKRGSKSLDKFLRTLGV